MVQLDLVGQHVLDELGAGLSCYLQVLHLGTDLLETDALVLCCLDQLLSDASLLGVLIPALSLGLLLHSGQEGHDTRVVCIDLNVTSSEFVHDGQDSIVCFDANLLVLVVDKLLRLGLDPILLLALRFLAHGLGFVLVQRAFSISKLFVSIEMTINVFLLRGSVAVLSLDCQLCCIEVAGLG